MDHADGCTPLIEACSTAGNAAAVERLLDRGADPNTMGMATTSSECPDEDSVNETPLTAAAWSGCVPTMRVLLDYGADVNLPTDDYKRTALYSAAHEGNDKAVELLLARRADVNQSMQVYLDTVSPLSIACQFGHVGVIAQLVACPGLDVHCPLQCGATPLYLAAQDGNTTIVNMLARVDGVDMNKGVAEDGTAPLYIAIDEGHVGTVAAMLRRPDIDVFAVERQFGATAMHAACNTGDLGGVQLFAVYGASTAILDADSNEGGGQSPRQWAVDCGHVQVVAWIDATKAWSQLQVAAGCRLARDLAVQLRQGRFDPDALPPAEHAAALATARTPAADLPWDNAPDICPATVQLIRAAAGGWGPRRHWLHHANVREAVRTVLHVSEWLRRRPGVVFPNDPLPFVPPELWLVIVGFFLRRDWQVAGVRHPVPGSAANPIVVAD
jgi:ankyrin repeat protein